MKKMFNNFGNFSHTNGDYADHADHADYIAVMLKKTGYNSNCYSLKIPGFLKNYLGGWTVKLWNFELVGFTTCF